MRTLVWPSCRRLTWPAARRRVWPWFETNGTREYSEEACQEGGVPELLVPGLPLLRRSAVSLPAIAGGAVERRTSLGIAGILDGPRVHRFRIGGHRGKCCEQHADDSARQPERLDLTTCRAPPARHSCVPVEPSVGRRDVARAEALNRVGWVVTGDSSVGNRVTPVAPRCPRRSMPCVLRSRPIGAGG